MKKSLPKLIFLSLITVSISSLCLPVQAAPQKEIVKPQTLQVSQTKSSVKKSTCFHHHSHCCGPGTRSLSQRCGMHWKIALA
jgi:Neuraminidase (sialidase)